ncbi:MAG: hypothetical protein QOF09_1281 [Alphaproteobacteria bacterium]|nr:hypothetical protein [Alphaproteobacteria bacterium]
MTRRHLLVCATAMLYAALLYPLPQVQAAEKIVVGAVGSPSTLYWPIYIGLQKGYFAAEDLTIDMIYPPSSAATIQQLAANSINMTVGVGLVDPIRAIDKGAPIGIVRVIVQAAPYVLVAKPAIKKITELKGKTISIGGPKDITRIYLDRMLMPNGIKDGEVEMVFAGSTAARFAALQSGAIDATFLTAPFNFYATAAGFADLGQTADYVQDLPFMGAAVHRPWASANQAAVRKFLVAFGRAVVWFEDDRNRAEAIDIMIQAGNMKPEDIERSYEFFRKGNYFEPKSQVSKRQLGKLVDALRELGDIQGPFDVNRLIASDVAEVVD